MKYRKGSFITVPNVEVLKELDSYSQTLFMWMCHHANQDGVCFPSRQKLSTEGGMSLPSVKRSIKKLVDIGIIKKTERKKGKKNMTNLYEVIICEVGSDRPHLGSDRPQGVGSERASELNPIITKPNKIDFETFWNLYDYKKSKPKAEKKWNSLDIKTQKKIIDYIPKYKESTPDKTYRKHPITFLNNECWEDEIIDNKKKEVVPVYSNPLPIPEEITPEQRQKNLKKLEEIKNKFNFKSKCQIK